MLPSVFLYSAYSVTLLLPNPYACNLMSGVDVKKNVIVTISSDKGLCGGINSTSVKISKAVHKLNSGILSLWSLTCKAPFLFHKCMVRSHRKSPGLLHAGPENETKYVVLGEKAKAQMVRDSKKDILLTISELQKNPLNYTQVRLCIFLITTGVPYMKQRYFSRRRMLSWAHDQLVYI